MIMERNERILTYLAGAFIGSLITMMIGFGLGGWLTEKSATRMASEFSRAGLTAAFVPFCTQRAKNDPEFEVTLARIRKADHINRTKILLHAGWATMSGGSADYVVAQACMLSLTQSKGLN